MSAAIATRAGVVGPKRCQTSRLTPKPVVVHSKLCSRNHTRKRVCCRSSDAFDIDLAPLKTSTVRASARESTAPILEGAGGVPVRSARRRREPRAPNRTTLIAEQATITHHSATGRYEQAIASAMPPRIDTAIRITVSGSPEAARPAFIAGPAPP